MGASTNAPIILSIFGFYVFVIVMMGLIGGSAISTSLSTPSNPTTNPLSIFDYVSYFFQGIGFSISELGIIGNSLLFLPLGITIAYIVASFVRGSS